jgi:predicted DCC family thiol-disulfide oxidoreductase YuxK
MSDSSPPWTHLLLFDGVCNLCDRSVQFILQHDPRGLIHFCSIQSETGSRLYRAQGLDPENPTAMLLLTPAGTFTESDAAIEIGRLLGGRLRCALLLKVIPKSLRDRAYRFIARNRYRWFGRKDQCMMPRPEWRQRFVE